MNSYEFLLKGKENHHKFTKEANSEAIKNLDLLIAADQNNAQTCLEGLRYGSSILSWLPPMTDEKMGELTWFTRKGFRSRS